MVELMENIEYMVWKILTQRRIILECKEWMTNCFDVERANWGLLIYYYLLQG